MRSFTVRKCSGARLIAAGLLFLLQAAVLIAGTTGKIAGRVTDAGNKEPLVGANVVVVGTQFGAATDVEGEYYIINLPPGIYTLRVTMMGYTTRIVEQVRVQVDLTTKIDLSLTSSTIEMKEGVTITAQRTIQKDLSSSERTVQSDQISVLPVRDVAGMLSMQAGITRDAGGELHIRGGRSTEISYMVDGIQVMNPVDRSAGISIDDQSIQELKAITGTFNAEYGQALSGVVNIVTKKGSDKFTVHATGFVSNFLSTDKELYSVMNNRAWAEAAARALSSKSGFVRYDFSQNGVPSYYNAVLMAFAGNKPWETHEAYLNGLNEDVRRDVQVSISGPMIEPLKSVSYFIAGRYQYSPSYQYGRRYFMPWGLWQPVSDTVNTFAMPDGKLMPLGWYEGYSTQSRVFFNTTNFNLSYGFYFNKDHSYNAYGKYLIDGGRHYYTDRYTHILSSTLLFSASTFLDVKASYYSNKHKNFAYEDPYDYRYLPTDKAGNFQEYVFKPTRESDIAVSNSLNDYVFFGNDLSRSKNTTQYFSGNIDLTSQVNKYHLIKVGVSGRQHDLEQDYYTLQFSDVNLRPIVPDPSSPFHTNYAAKPYEFAAYVQDKIEFEELVINIGMRFDYFYSDGHVLADPMDPQIYSPIKMDHIYKDYNPNVSPDSQAKMTVAERSLFWFKKPDAQYQVSPRFGMSFPISADGVIHVSYGHFFQNPEFRYLYENPNFWVEGAGSRSLIGNANLKAERTVMYEIGLQQKMFDNLFLTVTGFFRDIRDWVGTGSPIKTYSGLTYYQYENKDHAVAKGITVSGQYTLGAFYFSLDYTMMSALGTYSNPIDAFNAGPLTAARVQLISLNWDQRHAANLVIGYSNGGFNATLTGALQSGFPYTPTSYSGQTMGSNSATDYVENSERRPSTLNFDLHLSQRFNFGIVSMQAILDVTNVFDTRNALYVYSDTGLPDFTLTDYLSRGRFVEVTNSDEYFRNPGMYSAPRNITLGVRISYE